MGWMNFLQQLKSQERIPMHLPDDTRILSLLIGLDVSIYDFTSSQDINNLSKCFYYTVLVADFFNLPLSDTKQNIYETTTYKFVNHDRLKTNYHGLAFRVNRAVEENAILNKGGLGVFSLGISKALVDCAYAYDWSPTEVMNNFLSK